MSDGNAADLFLDFLRERVPSGAAPMPTASAEWGPICWRSLEALLMPTASRVPSPACLDSLILRTEPTPRRRSSVCCTRHLGPSGPL